MKKEFQDYYVNIRWMTIVIPILGIGFYEVIRFHILNDYFSNGLNSLLLMIGMGVFGYFFSAWLFKKISSIHDTLFWEQQRLKTIFTHTSDGIIVLGEDCQVLQINPAAEKLTGWKTGEVVGKLTCDEMNGCTKSKEMCWNSDCSEGCMNVDCGHRECWGKTCLEKKVCIPYVEMCLLRKNGERFNVAASYSYIPAVGNEKPQVKLVLRDISQRKELEKAIQNYATLEERYRLAREMHDGLAQALVYLNLKARIIQKNIENDQKELALNNLKEFRRIAQDAVNEIRQNIFNLKTPPGEESSCFLEWIDEYLNYFGTTNSLKTEFKCDCTENIILSTEVKVQLIRIIQEALANIRKHAQASEASIHLNKNREKIILKIIDNGKGINVKDLQKVKKEHFGLGIMAERARSIGGSLEIKNNDPSGTIVELQIPNSNL